MVSQPQHPEFRNNPKNFQPCIIDLNTTNIHTTCFVCVDALHPLSCWDNFLHSWVEAVLSTS